MGACKLQFEKIEILNKKSDTDHSDNDWLSVVWTVDHHDGSQPAMLQQTFALAKQNGDRVLDSGDVIAPVEASVPCLDTDLVTAVYVITNLGSMDWEAQAKAASQVTQGIAHAVGDIYLKIAEEVLQYLPWVAGNEPVALLGDAMARALEALHGPLLDLLDTIFQSIITPLIGDIADKLSNLLGHPNCSGEVMRDVAVFPPTTAEFKKAMREETYQGPQKNDSCGNAQHTRISWVTDRDLDVFIGTFGTTPPNYHPLWTYVIQRNGDLEWRRQDTNTPNWQGPKTVGKGWADFLWVMSIGGNNIYAISTDGTLLWYRHEGFNDGGWDWRGPLPVGSGWQDFARVFSGGDGVVYAIRKDGTLLWYSNPLYSSEGGVAWKGPVTVGSGWANFRAVFSMGAGIVYAVQKDGTLLWNRHDGFTTGAAAWRGPHTVGSGWNVFRDIIPAGDGIILGVRPDGNVFWYKHTDYETGVTLVPSKIKTASRMSAHWSGPIPIGSGWLGYHAVFGLLPITAPAQPH